MPRLTPIHWKVLECIFQKDGFVYERHEGGHKLYVKAGFPRPIVIPTYKEIDLDVIKSNMRTARMDRKRYFELLRACRKKS
jgi:predicted RNA binding protein YcfA (HicA-like mRNA interferase family)